MSCLFNAESTLYKYLVLNKIQEEFILQVKKFFY